jgi:type II secretory ATPase GspE/PulE/Tfp pilus assembly ATPase PilB-like protein
MPAGAVFSGSVCLALRVVPAPEGGTVFLADAASDRARAKALAEVANLALVFRECAPVELEKALARMREGELGLSAQSLGKTLLCEEAAEYLSDRRQSRVEMLVRRALDENASDIHIQPEPGKLLVRLRIDGALRTVETLPPEEGPCLAAQIKVLARLPLAGRRLPQDGRLSLELAGRRRDLRVSILPCLHGEALVLRLEGGEAPAWLGDLEMPAELLAAVRNLLSRKGGLILAAGPTGSGKTTTLYAMMRELAGPEKKLVSVEDPVERVLAGVNQVPVEKGGIDFAQAIRAILRHSPDAMMVGEIRDGPTALAAAEAALTGHLVLATVHARDGAEAILRLADLGVPREVLASVVEGALSQRLARLLCPHCAVTSPASPALARVLGLSREEAALCRTGRGCPNCSGTGWRGRRALFALIRTDASLREALSSGAGAPALRKASEKAGGTTLAQAARALVIRGLTSAGEAAVAAGLAEGPPEEGNPPENS